MAAVNEKLKFETSEQVNVIAILLLQIIAASEYYQLFKNFTYNF